MQTLITTSHCALLHCSHITIRCIFLSSTDKPTGGKDKPQDGSVDHSSPIPSINVQSPFQHPVFPGVSSAGAAMSAAKSVTNWKTLVLFAVNLSELDVVVNMSNVMGNTTSVIF